MQPFTRRRRGPILRLDPVAGSTLLTYIFEAILKLRPNPFGLRLPLPFGLFLPREIRSTPETRCQSMNPFGISFRISRLFSNRHSPPGHFYPSGSKRSARHHSRVLAFRVARSSFAPRHAKYLTIAARRISVPDPLLPVKLAVPDLGRVVEDAIQIVSQLVQKLRAFHWLPSPLGASPVLVSALLGSPFLPSPFSLL